MGEEGLVHELGLVLLPYPVPCLVVMYNMLENHNLQHLVGFEMGKPTFGDEVRDVLKQCIYSNIRLLPNTGDMFVPMSPKVLLKLNGNHDGI